MNTKLIKLLPVLCASAFFFACSNNKEIAEEPNAVVQPKDSVISPTDSITPEPDVESEEPKLGIGDYHNEIVLSADMNAINSALNNFSWKLFKTASADKNNENVLVSPLSLEVDLAMLLNGLTGSAQAELMSTMSMSDYSIEALNNLVRTLTEGVEKADCMTRFASANSFWYNKNYTVNSTFEKAISDNYGCDFYPTAFGAEATKNINEWVSKRTYNRINNFLDSTSPQDIMYLINAVYFRSSWFSAFNKGLTAEDKFTQYDGKTSTVEMMCSKKGIFKYAKRDTYQIVFVPFSYEVFGMFFILPNEGVEVSDIIAQSADYSDLLSAKYNEELDLYIPKFDVGFECELSDVMRMMGAEKLFTEGKDFCILDNASFPVSKILQKTTLTIDEEGAEAASATYIGWEGAVRDPEPQTPKVLKFNRPFIFGIYENGTKCPLFIGTKVK